MAKRQINFRASELTREQLIQLRDWWGATKSEVITVAVDRAYREELARRGQADRFAWEADGIVLADPQNPDTEEKPTD